MEDKSLDHEGRDKAPTGIPAVDSGSGKSELLEKARGEQKKSYSLVCVRAKAFLESVRDGAVARLKRDELYLQLAEVVFSYWAARLHHPRAFLDGRRERRIMARLRENGGDWGMLCYAVDGALRDDYLMGRRVDSDRKYDQVRTIFRDIEQVERLAEICPAYRAGEPHPIVRKYQNGNGHAPPD